MHYRFFKQKKNNKICLRFHEDIDKNCLIQSRRILIVADQLPLRLGVDLDLNPTEIPKGLRSELPSVT